jgi:hypothetical protein
MVGDQRGTIVGDFNGIGQLSCPVLVIDSEFEQCRQVEISFIFGAVFSEMVAGFIFRPGGMCKPLEYSQA